MDASDLKKYLFIAAVFFSGILFGQVFIETASIGLLLLITGGLWWGVIKSGGEPSDKTGHGGH